MSRLRRLPQPLIALLMAVLIVVVAYPEVVFLGGSLSPAGLNAVVDAHVHHETVQVYPNTPSHAPKDGVQDLGARVWQLVPATKFVHRSMSDNESFAWNPYSASGSLGPETLADIKLSPFVLIVALFGASATAFTFVTLAFLVLALYCLQQFFVRTLRLGRVAAVAGCVTFLFTGFGASVINSSVGAPYVLFPVVLYTLTEWRRIGGMPRLLAAIAAYTAFFLTTFVPVQLLLLIFIHAVATTIEASKVDGPEASPRQRVLRSFGAQLLIPGVAIGLTAFMWLPVFDALRHAGSDVASYGEREVTSSGKLRMLKIASPWLSNANKWVGYIGLTPVILIAAAWSRARAREKRILMVCAVLGLSALALHAGIPVIRSIASLPGLRSVRRDYWTAVSAAAITVSIAVAVSVIGRKGANSLVATMAGVAIGFGVLLAWLINVVLGWNAVPLLGLLAALAVIAIAVAIARASKKPTHRHALAIAAVALVAVELFSYQNHSRLTRVDLESHPPAYVAYLQKNIKTGRILNSGRGDLYPEWGSVFGIPQIETLNTMQVPPYRTFFQRYINPQEKSLFLQIGGRRRVTFQADPSALNVLSVRYLVIDQSLARYDAAVARRYPLVFHDGQARVNVYRNKNAFPNAYLSPALTSAQKPGVWSALVTQTTDRKLLAAARAAGIPATVAADAARGTARIGLQTNTTVRIAVKARQPSVLVLTDADYHNWSATVDGKPTHIGRVNDVVRGIVVPKGASTVEFTYHSTARSIGEVISCVTLGVLALVTLGALVVSWRRRRARA